MPRTTFREIDLDAAVEVAPELADTVANIATGHDALVGKTVRVWITETKFAQLDETFAVDTDTCDRCGARGLEDAMETTCFEMVCPECWDDEPRPCHRECFE